MTDVDAGAIDVDPPDDRLPPRDAPDRRRSGRAQVAALERRVPLPRPGPARPRHGGRSSVHARRRGADAVGELIEREAHDGRAILVGLSLGGYVAMDGRRAVARTGRRPRRSPARPPIRPGSPAVPFRALAVVFGTVPGTGSARSSRGSSGVRYPAELADPIVAAGFWFRGGAAAVRALIGERFRPRLAAYPRPEPPVNGEFDLFFRPASGASRAARRPATGPDPAGDAPRRTSTSPSAFTAAVRRFARSLPPAGETAAGR